LRQYSTRSGFPAGNPIANVLVIIAGALVIGASIVLGFFAFVILATAVLVSAAVIGIRIWWLKRKMQRRQAGNGPQQGPRTSAGVIEGEYKIVVKERDEA
jgi:predicted lipid-binding transport protein (Tim44 family)